MTTGEYNEASAMIMIIAVFFEEMEAQFVIKTLTF